MATRKKAKKTVEKKKELVPLTSIEVLVLKGLEALSTLLVIRLLLQQGYLLVNSGKIIKDPLILGQHGMLDSVASVGFLRFDHEHKLMHVIPENEAEKSDAISSLTMTVSIDTEYSSPTPHHPYQINMGTAIYIRVA